MADVYVHGGGREADAGLLIMAVLLILLMFLGLVAYSLNWFYISSSAPVQTTPASNAHVTIPTPKY